MDTNTVATIAFVGCAHIHTPGFVGMVNKRDDVTCKYVYDADPRRAEKRAADLKGSPKVVATFQEILADEDVSGLVICTETTKHEEIVLPAAQKKKHLFVEKPLGYSAEDAYRMADAIEKAGVLFQTGYFMRGDAKLQFLKEQIAAGAFGKITRVRGSNCHGGALGGWFDSKPNDPANDWRWMADPKIAGVGGFGDLGTHALDILLWLFGEATDVTAQIDKGTARYEGCDETGEGLLRFASGTIGTLAAGWDDVANPVSFLISGTEGHAAIINGQLHFKSNHVPSADASHPIRNAEMPSSWPHAFDIFLDAVLGKEGAKEKLVGIREAAYRSAVMEALYTGAKENRWVTPEKA